MIRPLAVAVALASLAGPSIAAEFKPDDQGQIEFTMPSGNIQCTYTPEGGTAVYDPVNGSPELSCDRVAPSYVRVVLSPTGKARRYNGVGDASCCSAGNVLDYGEVWKRAGFRCTSATTGLSCKRGKHGFSISRKAVKTY